MLNICIFIMLINIVFFNFYQLHYGQNDYLTTESIWYKIGHQVKIGHMPSD